MSIQTLTPGRTPCNNLLLGLSGWGSADERLHARAHERRRLALDVALVPEREREQPPQLPAEIIAAGDVVVDHPPHRSRVEEPLPPQGVGRQGVPRERLELTAQPRGRGNREASLLAVHDPAWHERLGGLPEQHLLRQSAHLVPRR